jgi:four helix bundle protein
VWQAAMDLAQSVFELTAGFPKEQKFVLAAPMQPSALSIPSHIAQGHGRKSTGAFIDHLAIAAGSLRELETQIELARRLDLLRIADAPALSEQMDKVGRMLSRLTTSLKAK